MGAVGEDLRFARRMFSRRRKFSLLLLSTIAIGVGAATSIFSLVDTVLWKPLPYRDASRLYWIARTDASWRASPVLAYTWDNLGHTYRDYQQWTATQRSFEATGAWFATTAILSSVDAGAEELRAGRATASMAPLLGIRPVRGRWFVAGEDSRDAPHVAVLSYGMWQSRFGGRADIIGSRLTLNAEPYEIVGVLPSGFRLAGDSSGVELWTPAGSNAIDWTRNNFNFRVFARLRRGVSLADATREASRLLVSPQAARTVGVRIENLQSESIKSVRRSLSMLLWSALLLLVIACSNVGTLLVGETVSRDVEIATRLSLGATRARITRQLFTENLLLATLGGALGALLAVGLVRLLRVLAPRGIPRIEAAHVDGRTVAFAVVVTAAAALFASLAPLATVFRSTPGTTLREGSSRLTRQRSVAEHGGVFVQAALVVVLLAAAALLLRSHARLVAVNPGFDAHALLGIELRSVLGPRRSVDDAARRAAIEGLAARLGALPGVDRAAATFAIPFQRASTTDVNVAGSPVVSDTARIAGTYVVVSPGYFETMGVRRVAGRLLGPEDDGPGTAVVVSETFARRFWPNANAIGQRIRVDEVWRDIVGVAADLRHRSVDEDPRTTFYLPARQTNRPLGAIVVRTQGDPLEQIASIRRVVAREAPTLAIARVDRISDLVDATLVGERFRTILFGVFASTAVILAAIGIVGVTINAASQRRRELAIRMAVGARPGDAVRLVMRRSIAVAVSGAITGMVLSVASARAIAPFLYGVSAADRTTYFGVLTMIVIVAAVAAWLPARRVARADLMRELS